MKKMLCYYALRYILLLLSTSIIYADSSPKKAAKKAPKLHMNTTRSPLSPLAPPGGSFGFSGISRPHFESEQSVKSEKKFETRKQENKKREKERVKQPIRFPLSTVNPKDKTRMELHKRGKNERKKKILLKRDLATKTYDHNNDIEYSSNNSRFEKLKYSKATDLSNSYGVNANRVTLGERPTKRETPRFAHVTQYPAEDSILKQLKLFQGEGITHVHVLTSSKELAKSNDGKPGRFKNPPYLFDPTTQTIQRTQTEKHRRWEKVFTDPENKERAIVKSRLLRVEKVKGSSSLNKHTYEVSYIIENGSWNKLTVTHITNWDKKGAIDVESLESLATDFFPSQGEILSGESRKSVIHGTDGLDRTGTLLAAVALKDGHNKAKIVSSTDAVMQIKRERSSSAIKGKKQLKLLDKLALKLNAKIHHDAKEKSGLSI